VNQASGIFITFEGGEGAGKSTQINRLANLLRKRGHNVLVTREPGGSQGAEAVRHVLLGGQAEEFGVRMEAILFAAARNDHVEQLIRPALEEGAIVLCDRFMDSTRVYQGVTGNLEPAFTQNLERIAVDGVMPDLTIIIDVPAKTGLERARKRGSNIASGPDRFEKEELATHEKRRDAFHELCQSEPDRCKLVDGTGKVENVALSILELVDNALPELPNSGKKTGKH